MKRYLLLILALALCACSHEKKVDSAFLKSDVPLLKVDGKVKLQYKEPTHQMGYSAANKRFWICTDNQSDYYIVSFSDRFPSREGQTVHGTLVYSTKDSEKTLKNLAFSVKKTSGDGQFWLWNSDKRIAVTVFALER